MKVVKKVLLTGNVVPKEVPKKERGENPSGQLTWPMIWLTLSSRMIDWKKSFWWLMLKTVKIANIMRKLLKVHQCRFGNLPIIFSSYENNMLKISH